MNNGDMAITAAYDEVIVGGFTVKGLTKREHFALEIFKAIIIGNNADDTALGKGAALDAIESANILLKELD